MRKVHKKTDVMKCQELTSTGRPRNQSLNHVGVSCGQVNVGGPGWSPRWARYEPSRSCKADRPAKGHTDEQTDGRASAATWTGGQTLGLDHFSSNIKHLFDCNSASKYFPTNSPPHAIFAFLALIWSNSAGFYPLVFT